MRVVHATFGVGEVLAEKHDGYETLVAFPKFSQWVRTRDLKAADARNTRIAPESAPAPGADRDARSSSHTPASRIEARAILESMRLGIAPPVGIERSTVGRAYEVGAVRTWLRDEAEGALVLEGGYGAGKSHLLRYLRADALALGFAVATTGVSPTEGVLTVPRRAYAHLVRDLVVPVEGQFLSFEAALDRAAHVPAGYEAVRDHAYLGPALEALGRGPLAESTWAVLRGEQTRGALLPAFYEHQTAANLACYLLSGLGSLFAAAFDVRGVLLLFDEVETAPSTRYAYERAHSKNLLRGLTLVASDDDALLTEEIQVQGNETVGLETRLLYSGHLRHRYLHSVPSHLKTLFAVTPDTLLPVFQGFRQTVPHLSVESLNERELRALFELTCTLYQEAHGLQLGLGRNALYQLLRDRVPSDHPRSILKGAVELCDFLRYYPGKVPGDVLGR